MAGVNVWAGRFLDGLGNRTQEEMQGLLGELWLDVKKDKERYLWILEEIAKEVDSIRENQRQRDIKRAEAFRAKSAKAALREARRKGWL